MTPLFRFPNNPVFFFNHSLLGLDLRMLIFVIMYIQDYNIFPYFLFFIITIVYSRYLSPDLTFSFA
jgi:hypothetical protein